MHTEIFLILRLCLFARYFFKLQFINRSNLAKIYPGLFDLSPNTFFHHGLFFLLFSFLLLYAAMSATTFAAATISLLVSLIPFVFKNSSTKSASLVIPYNFLLSTRLKLGGLSLHLNFLIILSRISIFSSLNPFLHICSAVATKSALFKSVTSSSLYFRSISFVFPPSMFRCSSILCRCTLFSLDNSTLSFPS